MWFDVVVLVTLAFFGLRGAVKGVIFQLASIAGIGLCLACAGTSAKLVGPHINVQPPFNQWIVLFGTYLVCTFVAFSFARGLNSWTEKAHLGELNRHLGFLFGVVKGVVLCLVLTYMVVTFSPTARDSLKSSKTAPYAARLLNRMQPLMPERLHATIDKFLTQLDHPEWIEPGAGNPGNPFDPVPGAPVVGDDIRFMNQPFPSGNEPWPGTTSPVGSTFPGGSNPAGPQGTTQDFWTEVQSRMSAEAQRQIASAWQNADPQTRQKIENDILTAIRTTPPDQWGNMQNRIVESGRQGAVDLVGSWFSQQFGGNTPSTPARPASQPSYSQPSYSQPASNSQPSYSQPYSQPSPYGTAPQSQPSYGTPPAGNAPTGNPAPTGNEKLLTDIVVAQSPFAPFQQKLRDQINGLLGGVPEPVGAAVLSDWKADLYRERDPDPQTDATTPIETRLLRQLQKAGVPENRLSREVQQRLNSFRLSSELPGDLR